LWPRTALYHHLTCALWCAHYWGPFLPDEKGIRRANATRLGNSVLTNASATCFPAGTAVHRVRTSAGYAPCEPSFLDFHFSEYSSIMTLVFNDRLIEIEACIALEALA
jgi:hypothetical protein